jgi:hypothetical protein
MSFGDGSGPLEAIQVMRREPGRWIILERILKLGGKFKTFDEFSSPVRMFICHCTLFAEFGDGSEVFNIAVVTGENVNVRAGPSTTASVITQLSHWVVQALPPSNEADKWVKIRTNEGKDGFVNTNYIAWPIGYRAGFQKHEGQWKLRFFL